MDGSKQKLTHIKGHTLLSKLLKLGRFINKATSVESPPSGPQGLNTFQQRAAAEDSTL